MKRIGPFCFLLLLFWTSTAAVQSPALSPAQMLEEARFILVAEVKETKQGEEGQTLILESRKVYRGELEALRLSIPLPGGKKETTRIPPAGTYLLLFLTVNDAGRLAPVARLNWAATLVGERVTGLFYGAATGQYTENDYIEQYNSYLNDTPAREVTPSGEESGLREGPPGTVNPAWFFMMAGVALVLMTLTAMVKKSRR